VILNCFLYTITTPTGATIGVLLRNSDILRGTSNLLCSGILDGLAAGILLWNSLVALTAEEFGMPSFMDSSNFKITLCFICFYFGAGVMALLGIWT